MNCICTKLESANRSYAELKAPFTDHFIGHNYTTHPHDLLEVAKTESEAEVEPHSVADDLRWEAVAAGERRRCAHRRIMPHQHWCRTMSDLTCQYRGQSCWVGWRYFCPKFLRQTFHEYAGESIKHSFWAKAYYEQQRAKGKSHQAAVRSLAFKWVRIIFRCWQTRTAYDEVKYLESLRRKRSSLLSYVANNPT
jgi:hypothetical protein